MYQTLYTKYSPCPDHRLYLRFLYDSLNTHGLLPYTELTGWSLYVRSVFCEVKPAFKYCFD